MTLSTDLLEDVKQHLHNQPGPGAKYTRLSDALSTMIREGRLKAGQQLPADKHLAPMLGVSVGTVQKALTNLSKLGVITRAPKRGTTIVEQPVRDSDIFIFRFQHPGSGKLLPPRVKMLSVNEWLGAGPWQTFLDCERVVRIERLMQIDMEPTVYSEVFIPFEHGEELLTRPLDSYVGFSIHRHIELCHGAPTLRTDSKVSLGNIEEEAGLYLMRESSSACLIWEVKSFTLGDRPASFQRLRIPKEHRPLEFQCNFDL